MLVHITVGDPNWIPTQEELDEIKQRFLNEKVFVTGSTVKVNVFDGTLLGTLGTFGLGTEDHKRLVITAGTSDWSPTKEELQKLHALFTTATLGTSGVVVTRYGVKAKFITD